MLVAEGFEVSMHKTRRPHVLRVTVNGEVVWSLGVWRRVPDQKELAGLVRDKFNGV
jgi:hypothetical protein